ncbi:hypothetical protein [Gemmata sp.]|uniref:hypothetical protein n=1 Tax=Gemmata sp. TaxID=1914242 RepID=UPI003F70C9BC
MTTGILEGIQAQLARVEAKLDATRQTEAVVPNDSIWANGAMDLAAVAPGSGAGS